jgi:hypothetical protein
MSNAGATFLVSLLLNEISVSDYRPEEVFPDSMIYNVMT